MTKVAYGQWSDKIVMKLDFYRHNLALCQEIITLGGMLNRFHAIGWNS